MAVSTQNTYTGDDATKIFSFTFPYIDTTDVKVSLNGVTTTEYILNTATQVQFNTLSGDTSVQKATGAPKTGVSVRIYRETDDSNLKATFFAGSAIRASDLNDNFLQSNYAMQEVVSRYVDNTSASFTGALDLNNNKITELGTGVASTDAVNKGQLDTALAGNAATVQASETAAAASASASQAAAISASTAATAAAASQATATTQATASATSASASAASASAAAAFAGQTVFYGWKRDASDTLLLDYSVASGSGTYSTGAYEYGGGSQWYLGSTDTLHTSSTGGTLGTPRFAMNTNGHLILTI